MAYAIMKNDPRGESDVKCRNHCGPQEEWTSVGRKGKSINAAPTQRKKECSDPGFEWVKVDAIVDSGAAETLCGKQHVPKESIRQTKASKGGEQHYAADGGEIPNRGEGDIKGNRMKEFRLRSRHRCATRYRESLLRCTEYAKTAIWSSSEQAVQHCGSWPKAIQLKRMAS